jgi:hypothetical protein
MTISSIQQEVESDHLLSKSVLLLISGVGLDTMVAASKSEKEEIEAYVVELARLLKQGKSNTDAAARIRRDLVQLTLSVRYRPASEQPSVRHSLLYQASNVIF